MTDADRCREKLGLRRGELDGLVLDPFTERDRASFRALMELSPEMTWERRAASQEYLDHLFDFRIRHYEAFGFGPFAVRESDSLRVIGQAGLQVLDAESAAGTVEIIVFIAPDQWGTGLARRLMRWWLDRAFCDAKVDAVWATARNENPRALAVIERFGFDAVGAKLHYGFPSQLSRIDSAAYAARRSGR